MSFLPAQLIKKKREGFSLNKEEISFFIQNYTAGKIPDYQMSALLMAVFFKGMNDDERLWLTQEMLHSGVVVDLSRLSQFKVDKHSTGGVGDKTSLILGPIVAAAGLVVPMISGRGLGHTGGTLDKLESIPGFNTQLSIDQFIAALEKYKICFIGQTKEICPADKKIYALRDVTATIESLPLICASIMSKKLAEGIDGLVLDVKFGSGAFMKKLEDAQRLANGLMQIAKGAGKKVSALLTSMEQPLGTAAGNSLEVEECVAILKNEKYPDIYGNDRSDETRLLSVELAAHMLFLSTQFGDLQSCRKKCEELINTGKAYEKFLELCKLHGGNLDLLPKPKYRVDVLSKQSGYIAGFNTEQIGWCGVKIRAGRAQTTDVIEPTAGILFHAKIGDQILAGDPLFSLLGADKPLLESIQEELLSCVSFNPQHVDKISLIYSVIN